jgi:hypothetical protein
MHHGILRVEVNFDLRLANLPRLSPISHLKGGLLLRESLRRWLG